MVRTALVLTASCANPPGGRLIDTFDELGVHVVGHAPESCFICDIYTRAEDYVVAVIKRGNLGAGAIVSADGLVATNAHVLGAARECEVQTRDERVFPARLVASDAAEDLALLRVDAPGRHWKPVDVDGGELPKIGSDVYIIGHPLGLGWTVTRGIVSGIRHDGHRTLIQTDAAISPGNSGGPMLDADGNLIGIVTSKLVGSGVENVAFARPASALLEFLAAHGDLGVPAPQAGARR